MSLEHEAKANFLLHCLTMMANNADTAAPLIDEVFGEFTPQSSSIIHARDIAHELLDLLTDEQTNRELNR